MNILNKHYFVDINELLLCKWQVCQNGNGDFWVLRRSIKEQPQTKRSSWFKPVKEVYNEENDIAAWNLVQKSFVDRLGVPNANKEFANLQRSHTKAIYKYLATEDRNPNKRMLLNDIDFWQDKINGFLKTSENTPKNTVEETLLTLSKGEGMKLTVNNTTVLDFHLLIEKYKNNG